MRVGMDGLQMALVRMKQRLIHSPVWERSYPALSDGDGGIAHNESSHKRARLLQPNARRERSAGKGSARRALVRTESPPERAGGERETAPVAGEDVYQSISFDRLQHLRRMGDSFPLGSLLSGRQTASFSSDREGYLWTCLLLSREEPQVRWLTPRLIW